MKITNCHTHLFTIYNVPHKFLPLQLVRYLIRYKFGKSLALFLNNINPFSRRDVFDRYANFLLQGDEITQEDIFQDLQSYYPEGSRFVVLAMDMDFMKAGKAVKPYLAQLEELAELKAKFPDLIFPFVAIDPRRENLLDLIKKYIEEKHFSGLKMYPPLGFFPCDNRLNEVFAYASKHQLPIMTHCTRGGVFYQGKISKEARIHPKTGRKLPKKANKFFTDYYSEVENYGYILEEFPNLKICLAHFGGLSEWEKFRDAPDSATQESSWFYQIQALIRKYPNVYTDISYTAVFEELLPLLLNLFEDSDLRQKILFGSDFYMANIETSEDFFSQKIPQLLGQEIFQQIAETNPKKYLNLD